MNRLTGLFFILVTALSCTPGSDTTETPTPEKQPNILFILADDLGKDAISGYQEGSIKPNTPHLDAFRTNGLLFTDFWVNPTCTPTRSAIITGRYGYHTGVKGVGDVLNSSETVIQKYINDKTKGAYATAVIGKWHLSGNTASFNPESFGIDYYAGLIRGAVDNYFNWQLTQDGTTSLQTTYTTEAFTDLAINWLNEQTKPWFLWLAYNAPHTPFHAPPANMHSQGALPAFSTGMDPLPYYMAAIEAMDFQIGRLLDNLPDSEKDNTLLIFIGDNGTPNQVAQSPYTSSTVKNTLYQGGINVPLFISGKGVTRTGSESTLLTATDLFATFAGIAGVEIEEYQDSKNFQKLFTQPGTVRETQYSELKDGTIESWTISNGAYKLVQRSSGSEELYYLPDDPYEKSNLMATTLSTAQQSAKQQLEAELATIRQ